MSPVAPPSRRAAPSILAAVLVLGLVLALVAAWTGLWFYVADAGKGRDGQLARA